MKIKDFLVITALMPLFVNCQLSWKAKYLDSVCLEAPNNVYAYIKSKGNLDNLKHIYEGKNTIQVEFNFNNYYIDSAEEVVYVFNFLDYPISYERNKTFEIAKLLNGYKLNNHDFGDEDMSSGYGVFRIELKKLWAMQKKE